MTNEQLAILLESVCNRLSRDVDDARQSIAEARPAQEERIHSDPRCIGIFCQNGEHYSTRSVPDPVDELAPLDSSIQWLGETIATLRSSS